jgi:5-methylcytosine-specific restriction endonuclease McrA
MTKHTRGERKVYDHRWTKFRAWFLSHHPVCNTCGRAANEVDHVTPLSRGGGKYDLENLQALCKSCHSRKTQAEMNGRKPRLGCDLRGVPQG